MKNKREQSIYKRMQRLAMITETFLLNGNLKRARRCMNIAEELLHKGNAEMRCAVANVFVFSVSAFMEVHHFKVKSFFSQSLQSEYYRQVYGSGC